MKFLSRYVSSPFGVFAGALVLVLMALTVVDVTARKLAGQGIPGVIEYAEILLVMVVFFSLASGQVGGVHVKTSVLTSRLGPRARRWVHYPPAVLGMAVVATMIVISAFAAWQSYQSGEYRFGLAQVPIWPARAAVTIGLTMFLFEYVRTTIEAWHRRPPAVVDPETELQLGDDQPVAP